MNGPETLNFLLNSPQAAAAAMSAARQAAAKGEPLSGAILRVYIQAAGSSQNGELRGEALTIREAAQEAAKEFIFKNILELEALAPKEAKNLRLFARPAMAIQDWPQGPGLTDLLPRASDIAEGFSNVFGDIRKTALVVVGAAAAAGAVFFLLTRPPAPRKRLPR